MFCYNCGAPIPDGSSYCAACGVSQISSRMASSRMALESSVKMPPIAQAQKVYLSSQFEPITPVAPAHMQSFG